MGAAYFIILNQQDPGFDTTLDGRAIVSDPVRSVGNSPKRSPAKTQTPIV